MLMSRYQVQTSTLPQPLRDGLLVAALGGGVLLLAHLNGCPGLVWSDEVVYAVVGRNIQEGRGPLSNYYHPDAIVADGFPLRDVHLPAHAYLIGLSFAVFGAREWAALVPNQVAFLLGGVVLFDVARRTVGRRSAFAAAAMFYLFPPQPTFAHTAMSEPTLVLVAVAALWLWVRCRDQPRPGLAALLGVVLALGAAHRESFLVFLPAAAYVLWRWPRPERGRAAAAFAVAFLAGMVLVFWPWHTARPRIPHTGFALLAEAGEPRRLWTAIRDTANANLAAFFSFAEQGWQRVHTLQVATVLVAALAGLRAGGVRRELAALAAWSYLATFMVMLVSYPLSDWRAVRQFMFTLPPAFIVAADAALARRGLLHGIALRWAAPALLLFTTADAHAVLTRGRRAALAVQREYSSLLADVLRPYGPRLIIAPAAYRYGWDMYPVSVVIWDATDLPRTKAVDHAVRVDAIVVQKEARRLFLSKLERGAYRGQYREANRGRSDDRYAVFVNVAP
jgi:hypothetical protein